MDMGFVLMSAAYLSVIAGVFTRGVRTAVRTHLEARDSQD